jgi:uncharacterized membrane protein YhfC
MIYLVYALNFSLMIAMPLLLARFIAARRGASWALFGKGAVTFVLSQVLHIPFNWIVLQRLQLILSDTAVLSNLIILALFLGLSAGLFEEVGRYLTYRYWATEARTWGKGLMLGAGHGGIEAILIGVLGGVNILALTLLPQDALLQNVPAEQMELAQAQLTAVFTTPWHLIMLGAVERLFALCAHLAMSVMVLQVFMRGQVRWLAAAVLWHTLLNAVAVFAVATWNPYVTEALIGVVALLSVGIIFWLRALEPVEAEPEPLPELAPFSPEAIEITADKLDRSRYL